MATEKYRFAWTSTLLFAISIAVVVTLNILQKHALIDKQMEGLLRLLVNGSLAMILIHLTFQYSVAILLRVAIVVTIFSALGETALDYTEDVPSLDDVFLIGQNSGIRRSVESVLAAGWMLGGFSMLLLSIRSVVRADLKAKQRIEQLHRSTCELEETNQRLEQTLQELRTTQDLVVRRERLSALGEMASGVAHDLNNALTPASIYSEILCDSCCPIDPTAQEDFESILRSISDAKQIIGRLQLFYSDDARQRDPVPLNLADPIRQVVSMTRPKWKQEPAKNGKRIDIELRLEDTDSVLLDPAEFRVVLTNLMFNAVEAMESGGSILLHLTQVRDSVQFSIADTGCGMSATTLQRCFEPFYTTREEGSGLGLSACYGIISRAGGELEVRTREDSPGVVFTIRLPRVDAISTTKLEVINPVNGTCRLLLVDDEVEVCSATAAMLRTLGAEVVVETSGSSAIFRYLRDSSFDLLLTDLGMPDVDGRTVVDVARNQNPAQRVAVISGWPRAEVLERFSGVAPPDVILSKPPAKESLRKMLVDVQQN